jgi:type IV secretory pathway TraG/TraD family ATPase VirD4
MGFWSNLASRTYEAAPAQTGEWEAVFGQTGAGAGIPLGTARWMDPETGVAKFRYSGSLYPGRAWIGEGFDSEASPLGYQDDRHVCLVSGSRGGKGVGVIVPNLCFWRRTDPYWELAGRNLIKGLILHVLSATYLAKDRNLITVRRLLTQGDWITLGKVRSAGVNEELPSAFEILWSQMRMNPAFNGVVAGVGEQMIAMADKQRSGVLEAARTNTEFLDSLPMQRLLETSDFDLGELKTNPKGLSIYLTLPQRFMETHYRWLRLMITLAVGEMERIKGRPATGNPTLFVLDEFAGLKRMEVIENAAAQAAGMGIKFLFVVQNLAQLNEIYEKSWETFFGNSGLKLFFQIDDDFSRSYLSRQLGELETLRQTRSGSQSQSTSWSTSNGRSSSTNVGASSGSSWGGSTGSSWTYSGLFRFFFSKSRSDQVGHNWSHSRGTNWGRSECTSFSRSQTTGDSFTSGWGEGVGQK